LELAKADSVGTCTLPLARDLYPAESLAKATAAFFGYCAFEIETSADEAPAALTIRVREEHRQESRKIIGSFLSYLLEQAVQERLRPEAET